jgi:SAM-dependent methyltransferase
LLVGARSNRDSEDRGAPRFVIGACAAVTPMHEDATPAAVCCPVCGGAASLYRRLAGGDYHRCGACGGLFLHPFPTPDRMRAYADAEYGDGGLYGEYAKARDLKVATFRRRLRTIRRFVSGGRLLDLGCSCGFMLEVALESGFDAHGVEFSAAAIAAAAPSVRDRIRQGDVDQVPPGTQDVVTAFDILEHSQEPGAALRRWGTLLRPGGVLAITTPYTEAFLRRVMGGRWPHLQPHQHTFLFSKRQMPALFAEAGLETLLVEPAVKVMSAAYLLGQLELVFPWATRAGRVLDRIAPGPMRVPIPFRISEMFALARRSG